LPATSGAVVGYASPDAVFHVCTASDVEILSSLIQVTKYMMQLLQLLKKMDPATARKCCLDPTRLRSIRAALIAI